MKLALFSYLVALSFFGCDYQNDDAIYLLFEEGGVMTKEISPLSKEKYDYTFHIEKLSTEDSKYISAVMYKAITSAKPLLNAQRTKVEARDIQWLRSEYIKAFQGFKNKRVALGKNGEILEFDLSEGGRKIFVVEQVGDEWFKTEVQRIYQEE